jgi:hypothetical protein
MNGHSERQWEGKFFRCGMRCYYCCVPLTLVPGGTGKIATKDHLLPVSRGGSDLIDNIVPCCLECNDRKGTMSEHEFRTTFTEAFKLLTGVHAVSWKRALGETTNFSMIDQPFWYALRDEAHPKKGSWAWRNPYTPKDEDAA